MAMARAAALFLMSLLATQGLQIADDAVSSDDTEAHPEEDTSPSNFEMEGMDHRFWTVSGPAAGDPKLQNVKGRRFQVHRPGKFTLLKIPNGRKHHGALLEVTAEVEPMEIGDPCLLFLKKIEVTGAWMGGSALKVRAPGGSGRHEDGFAMRMDAKKHEGPWKPFANFSGLEEELTTDKSSGVATSVKAVIGRREGRMEDIKGPYEHRFLVRVAKEGYKGKKPLIDIGVPKPGRQFLTVKIEHVNGLIDEIGSVEGLLGGSDPHHGIDVRGECKDSPEHVKASELLKVSGGLSRASAHFE